MKYRKVGWKRNLRKIPNNIAIRLEKLKSRYIVASTVMKIGVDEIKTGKFMHLGISIKDDELFVNEAQIIPPEYMGKYSYKNINGQIVVRRDLPMTTKTYSAEVPNWGDWSNNSHTVYWDRDVYQREYNGPREVSINIEILDQDISNGIVIILFRTDEIIDMHEKEYEDDLLFMLNLLQENTGHANVFQSNASRTEYLNTTYVNWKILPPGERELNIQKILGTRRSFTNNDKKMFIERYDVLESLKPRNFIAGTDGFRRYFGARFSANLVVFENVDYGNAVYIMGEDWEKLSKLSRTELMNSKDFKFTRIPHSGNWKSKLKKVVKEQT